MQQLGSQDAMFVHMEAPRTPMHLGWLNIYDPATAPGGRVGYSQILEHIRRRLPTVRFFRQKLAFVPGGLSEPYWVDDPSFDLEAHVQHSGLPAPGDWQQLCQVVARIFARPLDFDRPLWEFYVIDGLDNVEGFAPGSFALLAKIHHAAVDGISGVDVSTALHAADTALPPADDRPWRPEPSPRPGELLAKAVAQRATRPGRFVRSVANVVPGFRNLKAEIDAGKLRKQARHKVPRTRFSGPIGPHRVMDARRFRIEEFRAIRTLVPGATVNDVLIAVVGGALRRYLLAKRELPDRSLTASCPISLRSEEQRGEFGNRLGNMFVALGTHLADPVERLRGIQVETANIKAHNDVLGAKTLTEMSQLVPGSLVSFGTRLATRVAGVAASNTTVTNVPGPQHALDLAGARLRSQFALGTLLEGMGVFHFIHSYCGEVTLTVTADRDKLPDPAFYAQCVQDSFDELATAAAAGPGRAA